MRRGSRGEARGAALTGRNAILEAARPARSVQTVPHQTRSLVIRNVTVEQQCCSTVMTARVISTREMRPRPPLFVIREDITRIEQNQIF